MQPAAQWGGDGVEDVDEPGKEDGHRRHSSDPAGATVGLAEIGGVWPRVALGIGGHHDRVNNVHRSSDAGHPLEQAGGPELACGQKQSNVEVGTGLELDPADPLDMEEDRREPELPRVVLDDFGGCSPAGVEANTGGCDAV